MWEGLKGCNRDQGQTEVFIVPFHTQLLVFKPRRCSSWDLTNKETTNKIAFYLASYMALTLQNRSDLSVTTVIKVVHVDLCGLIRSLHCLGSSQHQRELFMLPTSKGIIHALNIKGNYSCSQHQRNYSWEFQTSVRQVADFLVRINA